MRSRIGSAAALLAAVTLLGACGDALETRQPVSRDDGIQATGMLDGKRVAISRGNPIVTFGDCDPLDGADIDLCIEARTIDGVAVTIVIENPAVLVEGVVLQADNPSCIEGCDHITDVVVVLVRTPDEELRVAEGTIEVHAAGPRYTASFDLKLPFGDRLIGEFDVIETPDDEAADVSAG